jgi:hypothetical protein
MSADEIIAERELESTDEAGSKSTVVVQIFRPVVDPNPKGYWICDVVIKGLGKEKKYTAHGADSLQALMQAIEMAGLGATDLGHPKNAPPFNRPLTWLRQSDLGLPWLDDAGKIWRSGPRNPLPAK